MLQLIATLLVIALLLGSVFGWVAFFKLRALSKDVAALRRNMQNILHRIENHGVATNASALPEENQLNESEEAEGPPQTKLQVDADFESVATKELWIEPQGAAETGASSAEPELPKGTTSGLLSSLKDQWMVWLGGISVGLSGVFMVRYSIDQGLLGPGTRVMLSLGGGLALHAVAEYGRRRNFAQIQGLAALAGGASIILYAAILAALNLYSLISPTPAFIALTVISLATMALAVTHGPVLAILGILGAYAIPLLVETGSDSILGLYVYSLIITCAAIMLMQHVYRSWLWGYMLLGSLGWWLLSLGISAANGYRGYYLAVLAYIYLALPAWDWLLNKSGREFSSSFRVKCNSARGIEQAPIFYSLLLIVLAFAVSILAEASASSAIYYWTPLVGLLLVAAGRYGDLFRLALASLIIQLVAWLSLGLSFDNGIKLQGLIGPDQFEFMIYAGWMAFVYTSLSLRNVFLGANKNSWFALAILSPLAWLALCYLLVTDLSESLNWGAAAVGIGIFYLAMAAWRLGKWKLEQSASSDAAEQDLFNVWLILAGHFGYSLAVAIMFREAGLTLALSAQLLSIGWVIHRFNPPHMNLLLKLVLALVVVRLTLNPWLLTYSSDVHWSLWTYGGATLFCGLSAWRLRDDPPLQKWLEAATLHLLVLTLWAETRYYLYDGEVFRRQLDLLEFAINTALWSSLGLVYYQRHKLSQNLKIFYLLASRIMLGLALVSYLFVLFPLNPLWTDQQVSATPLLNTLLLAYGFPVVISLLLFRFYDLRIKPAIAMLAGLSLFVFVSLEIRHLWQGALDIALVTGNGELYTYTIVWLLMAVVCLLAGSIRFGTSVYRAGFGLMMLVIAKIFLFDMAGLEGLLRVASFMGLGLSLLGLAYLYQRFNLSPKSHSS